MVISCGSDGSCPYQFYCQANQCLHNPVFPLIGYPIAIYCLFPLASALCNSSGNSFGSFKVILLMDALGYTQAAATTLCYPLILGTAIYNFVALIFRRNPQKPTSLVDYNLVLIMIPNVLYGSIVGALLSILVPPIAANVLVTILLICFSINFFSKFRRYRKQLLEADKSEVLPQLLKLQSSQLKKNQKKQFTQADLGLTIELKLYNENGKVKQLSDKIEVIKLQVQKENLQTQQVIQIPDQVSKQEIKKQQSKKQIQNPTGQVIQINPFQQQLDQQIKYEQTNHYPHIIATVAFFAFFSTCSFLAQGKIIPFTVCSKSYIIGMVSFTLLYVLIALGMFQYTKRKLSYYKKIRFSYEYPLDNHRYFVLFSIGSLLGGFINGFVAIGNCTVMIFVLLQLGVEPIVATSTVGYQVIFSSASSLLLAISRNTISLDVVGFFIGITLVGGGCLSFLVSHFINKLNKKRVNIILMAIIGSLTTSSAISMVVNIALGFINFGKKYMLSSGAVC